MDISSSCSNKKQFNSYSLLYYIHNGQDNLAKSLIEACNGDIDLDYVHDDFEDGKYTPLQIVLEDTNFEMGKFLIEKGANINNLFKSGESPLSTLLRNKDYKFAKYLIQKGANIINIDVLKNSALHLVLEDKNFEFAKYLIEEKAIDINNLNIYKNSALHIALKKKYFDFAKYLIEKGSDLNVQNHRGDTALHIVLKLDIVSKMLLSGFVKYLVSKGANIEIENNYGNTAFTLAKESRLFDLIIFFNFKIK